jgi:hypothetical protein
MKPIELTMTSLNAALYATIGYLTFLGIFAPIIGVVRFWGIAVVVPAVFAALFGPLVGGIGAAIGIFMSDMIIHGNALLSLTVGVPANFVMFYLIGYISRKELKFISSEEVLGWVVLFTGSLVFLATSRIFDFLIGLCLGIIGFYIIGIKEASYIGMSNKDRFSRSLIILGSVIVAFIFLIHWLAGDNSKLSITILFLIFGTLCIFLLILFEKYWFRWRRFAIASIIGNSIGSAIVGFGIWAFSKFFILPVNLGSNLPITASLILFVWTFSNQMPFLLILCPPILKACHKIIPKIMT